ncbi:hypothetical protein N7462_007000 [Penicillium macrosclerotiorum]|uniref:uncharacterized protein n=1 Tax=Penicillium macrosclerotiorum TaxID=303699 RepID=UPI00254977AA|nr:uncharacterized protein N7462_007000 [Penicillium macrosclerotiorum]KAJ5678756.1 hypothetical protein N7462_007000 [Penicillium macrosclerotiorum]
MYDGTINRLLSSIYCLQGIAHAAFDTDDIYPPRLPDLRDPTPSYASTSGQGEVVDGGLDYVHYQIEWGVKLNSRVVAKNTEQDLALLPSFYWERIKDTAGNILRRKIAYNRRVRLDDTNLVVSVNERS